MTRRQFLAKTLVGGGGFIVVGGIASLLAACGGSAPGSTSGGSTQGGATSAPASGGTVTSTTSGAPAAKPGTSEVMIGAVWAHTGAAAGFARIPLMVTELFLEEFNRNGGIKSLGGAKLRFIDVDTQSSPDQAASQTERLIGQGVSMIVGTGQSAAGALVTQVCERLKTPVLLAVDIASDLTEKGFKYTFRICAKASDYAAACVNYADVLSKKSPISKVGVMHTDDPFGTAAGQVLESEVRKRSWTLVDRVPYPMTTQDFSPTLTKFRDAGVDALLLASYPTDAITITRQLRELGFNPKAILGAAGGHKTLEYIKGLGPLADYTMAGVGALPDMKIAPLQEFNERFVKKYNEPLDENGAYMMSTLATIVDVLERAGSTDREAVRNALIATDLKAGTGMVVTLPGVKFDAQGQNKVDVAIMQIQNGKQVTVYPEQYASAAVVYPKPAWS